MNNAARGGAGGAGAPGVNPAGSGGPGGDARGAAVFNAGSLTIISTTFSGNNADGGDGGAGQTPLSQNSGGGGGAAGSGGSGFGGAIFTTNGFAYVTNCTIAGNTLVGGHGGPGGAGGPCILSGCGPGGAGGPGGSGGTAAGGGLYAVGGTSAVVHCTIDANTVEAGLGGSGGPGGMGRPLMGPPGANGAPGSSSAGALAVVFSKVSAANSIFSRSQGSTNCSGQLSDLGINISSDNSSCFTNPASMKNLDPGLESLADHGGSTMTLALLPSSPAHDKGNDAFAPSTDQRGVPRPQGKACDVGAHESGHLAIEKSGAALRIRYGAPPGAFYRLQGRPDWGDWRDLGGSTAQTDGYARYGPIAATNRFELFRSFRP